MSSRVDAGRADRGERLARLRADRDLLASEHPYLNYRLDERRLIAEARGAVPMLLPDGQIEPVELQLLFHPQYPPRPPFVSEVGGRWTPDDDRHIPQDRTFCLYLRDVDEPDLREPMALSRFMLDVICFLDQQLIYDRIGRFPGPQWPHRENAYALHVIEQLSREVPSAAQGIWEAARAAQLSRNAPCPCGSRRKVKHCHLDLLRDVGAVAARHNLRALDYTDLRKISGVAS